MVTCNNASKMLTSSMKLYHPSLKHAIDVNVENIPEMGYVITYPPLCVYGKGNTYGDAMEDLINHIDMLYKCYVIDDQELTGDAIKLREDLIQIYDGDYNG